MRRTPTPVLVVTGYSGSGKTTLIERLLPVLRQRGYRIGVIKRHDHPLSLDTRGKDSDRFWHAGAEAVGLLGPGQAVLLLRPELATDARAMADMLTVDLVLAEGFKSTQGARLIVLGPDGEQALSLAEGKEVLALVGDLHGVPYPVLSPDDIESIADAIEGWLKQQGRPAE